MKIEMFGNETFEINEPEGDEAITIHREADGAFFPPDFRNADYRKYIMLKEFYLNGVELPAAYYD
jgi:hypothetical protein